MTAENTNQTNITSQATVKPHVKPHSTMTVNQKQVLVSIFAYLERRYGTQRAKSSASAPHDFSLIIICGFVQF
jgi:hypothetical protein